MDCSSWPVEEIEGAGSDAKDWLIAPDGALWLCKPAVVPTNGVVQGEDWSEWAASVLAQRLGIPHAVVWIAERHGHPVALSKSLRVTGEELQAGANLLQGCMDFVPDSPDRLGHSLANIQEVLQGVSTPGTWSDRPNVDAFGVFSGYLIFDALIANQDRHEENWGVIRDAHGNVRLAESFDHATSMGFNLTDGTRNRILASEPRLRAWAERGFATRFENSKKVTLVRHAVQALLMSSIEVTELWMSSVSGLDTAAFLAELTDQSGKTSRPSVAAASFAAELVSANRRRILDELDLAGVASSKR